MKNYKTWKIFLNGFILSFVVIFICIALFQVGTNINKDLDNHNKITLKAINKTPYRDIKSLTDKYPGNVVITADGFAKLNKKGYEEYLLMKKSNNFSKYVLMEGRKPKSAAELIISKRNADQNHIKLNKKINVDSRGKRVVGIFKNEGDINEDVVERIKLKEETVISNLEFTNLKKTDYTFIKKNKTANFEVEANDGNNKKETLLILLQLIVYITFIITIFFLLIMMEYEIKKILIRRKKKIFLLKSMGETNRNILYYELSYFLKPLIIGLIFGVLIGTAIIPLAYNALLGNFGGENFYQFTYNNYPVIQIILGVLICFIVETVLFYSNISKSLRSVSLKSFYMNKENNRYSFKHILLYLLVAILAVIAVSVMIQLSLISTTKIIISLILIMSILLLPQGVIKLINKIFPGKLLFAKSFLNSNQKKVSSIILVFTAILTLQFVVISATLSSLKSVNEGWKVILTGDGFGINPSGDKIDPQILDELKGIDHLYLSKRIYPTEKIRFKSQETNGFMVKGTDIDKYKDSVKGKISDGKILIGRAISVKLGIKPGDQIVFKNKKIEVSGVTSSGENGGDIVYMYPALFRELFGEKGADIATLNIVNQRSFEKSIRGKENVFYFRTNAEYIKTGINSVYTTLSPVIALCVIVALLGIAIIMLMLNDLIYDSRKAIVLLRSLGSGRLSLFKENLLVLCMLSFLAYLYALLFTQIISDTLNFFIASKLGSIVEINSFNLYTLLLSAVILFLMNLLIAVKNTFSMKKVSIAEEMRTL